MDICESFNPGTINTHKRRHEIGYGILIEQLRLGFCYTNIKNIFVFWQIKNILKAFYFQTKTQRYSTQGKRNISYTAISESKFV